MPEHMIRPQANALRIISGSLCRRELYCQRVVRYLVHDIGKDRTHLLMEKCGSLHIDIGVKRSFV